VFLGLEFGRALENTLQRRTVDAGGNGGVVHCWSSILTWGSSAAS
jgi:hypothetical protein